MTEFNVEEFFNVSMKTLSHCKELSNGINAVRMIQFCLENESKIGRIFPKHFSYWETLQYEGNQFLSLNSDEETEGTSFISNGIYNNYENIYAVSTAFDDIAVAFGKDDSKFILGDYSDFFLKYSRMSSSKMNLFNKSNDRLTTIVLSKTFGIFLENNHLLIIKALNQKLLLIQFIMSFVLKILS